MKFKKRPQQLKPQLVGDEDNLKWRIIIIRRPGEVRKEDGVEGD